MVNPQNPLYLTALTVIANILIHLWLILPCSLYGKEMPMATNDSQSLLDSLLFTAENKWGIDKEQILENMNKIAFHESKNVVNAVQKIKPEFETGGVGKGRGLYQFEVGKGEGANTALNRLLDELNVRNLPFPSFAKEMKGLERQNRNVNAWKSSGYDVATLPKEAQQLLFLGNLLQKPKAQEGYVPSSFAGVDTDEELAHYWAQHHQAGTEPGTPEYKELINKFLLDLQEGYRKKLIDK